jgi:hypothetical protein
MVAATSRLAIHLAPVWYNREFMVQVLIAVSVLLVFCSRSDISLEFGSSMAKAFALG